MSGRRNGIISNTNKKGFAGNGGEHLGQFWGCGGGGDRLGRGGGARELEELYVNDTCCTKRAEDARTITLNRILNTIKTKLFIVIFKFSELRKSYKIVWNAGTTFKSNTRVTYET